MKKFSKKVLVGIITTITLCTCTACAQKEPEERVDGKVKGEVMAIEKWQGSKSLVQLAIPKAEGDVGHFFAYLETTPDLDLGDEIEIAGGDLHQMGCGLIKKITELQDGRYEISLEMEMNGPTYKVIRYQKPEFATIDVAYDELLTEQ